MITISNLISRIPGGIAQGIIWGLMALGVYITFRVLKESDLTVDGSFATGGAICVMMITSGINPWIAIFCTFLAGLLVGTITGLIHTKLKIPAILSGILVQFGLYSINLHIMGMVANVSCNPSKNHVFISMRNIPMATEQGCAIRATGNNEHMALAQGINVDNMKVIGFALGNGLVALAGGLMGQYQGFSDINMGRGAIVIGLAAIIIGDVLSEIIFPKGCQFYTRLSFVIIGGIVYYLIMIVVLWLRVDSNDLKLATAIIVMLALAIPNLKKGVK